MSEYNPNGKGISPWFEISGLELLEAVENIQLTDLKNIPIDGIEARIKAISESNTIDPDKVKDALSHIQALRDQNKGGK